VAKNSYGHQTISSHGWKLSHEWNTDETRIKFDIPFEVDTKKQPRAERVLSARGVSMETAK